MFHKSIFLKNKMAKFLFLKLKRTHTTKQQRNDTTVITDGIMLLLQLYENFHCPCANTVMYFTVYTMKISCQFNWTIQQDGVRLLAGLYENFHCACANNVMYFKLLTMKISFYWAILYCMDYMKMYLDCRIMFGNHKQFWFSYSFFLYFIYQLFW